MAKKQKRPCPLCKGVGTVPLDRIIAPARDVTLTINGIQAKVLSPFAWSSRATCQVCEGKKFVEG